MKIIYRRKILQLIYSYIYVIHQNLWSPVLSYSICVLKVYVVEIMTVMNKTNTDENSRRGVFSWYWISSPTCEKLYPTKYEPRGSLWFGWILSLFWDCANRAQLYYSFMGSCFVGLLILAVLSENPDWKITAYNYENLVW